MTLKAYKLKRFAAFQFAKKLVRGELFYPSELSAIDMLLIFGRPSHVARLVMSIIIFAIQRMLFRRSQAHFLQKLLKRIEQKFDATTAVVVVITYFGIGAALQSVLIRSVFGGMIALSCVTVRHVHQISNILVTAAARLALAVKQLIGPNGSEIAAGADAHPSGATLAAFFAASRIGDHEPSAKCPPEHIVDDGIREKFRNRFTIKCGHIDLLNRLIRCGGRAQSLSA